MKTTRFKQGKCPNCGHKLNAASAFHNHPPKPSDLTICIECTQPLTWDRDMGLILLSTQDIARLPELERDSIDAMIKTIEEVKEET